jgi:hypothetical protein
MDAFIKSHGQPGGNASGEDDAQRVPRAVRRLRRQIPTGWNAVGVLPVRILRDSLAEEVVWELWKEVRRELPGSPRQLSREDLMKQAVDFAAVLQKYRLLQIVLLGGFEKTCAGHPGVSRARLRLVW